MFSKLIGYYDSSAAVLEARTAFNVHKKNTGKAHKHMKACEARFLESIHPVGSDEHIAMEVELEQAEAEHTALYMQLCFAQRAWNHALDEMYWFLNINSWYEYVDNFGLRTIPSKWTVR